MSETVTILDSGDRREFGTGAVRDMAKKGRCDLLPWNAMRWLLPDHHTNFCALMESATHAPGVVYIVQALEEFIDLAYGCSSPAALLDAAYLYEDGCAKYGERNWEKGIPVVAYLDSAGRHFLKWARDDRDERHDRAVVWNLLCALWTAEMRPKMIKAPITGVNDNAKV